MSFAVAVTQSDVTPTQLRSVACANDESAQVKRSLMIALILNGMAQQQVAEQCGIGRHMLRDHIHSRNNSDAACLQSRPRPSKSTTPDHALRYEYFKL